MNITSKRYISFAEHGYYMLLCLFLHPNPIYNPYRYETIKNCQTSDESRNTVT